MQVSEWNEEWSSFSDAELVRLYREGNENAFRQLVNRYFLIVKKMAADYAVQGAETEDLTQEGLIALHQAVQRYDESAGAGFKTFADVCIRNRMRSVIRREFTQKSRANRHTSSIEDAGEMPSALDDNPEDAIIGKENLRQLEEYLRDHLTPAENNVLSCYLSGMSYDAIAKKLGISRKSCDNAMQRVRKKLKERY